MNEFDALHFTDSTFERSTLVGPDIMIPIRDVLPLGKATRRLGQPPGPHVWAFDIQRRPAVGPTGTNRGGQSRAPPQRASGPDVRR
jgi:hypothetical protein